MDLLQLFKSELESKGVAKKSSFLLAVSGGVDSMVMLDLARNSLNNIYVAHANYHLRGNESDSDQKLVEDYCDLHGIACNSKDFHISPDDMPDGLQSTARDLRYTWFNELLESQNLDFILTAHHLNDNIETFFINLLRGSGVKGLKAIPAVSDRILRPLLKFRKAQLLTYAKNNNVPWRADKSNSGLKYLRNRIRHGLAQEYYNLSPNAESNASKSLEYLSEIDNYFQKKASEIIKNFPITNGDIFISDQQWIKIFHDKPVHKYIFESLGFYSEQLEFFESFPKSQSGKKIIGRTHIVYRDRGGMIVGKISNYSKSEYEIAELSGEITSPIGLSWNLVNHVNRDEFKNPNIGYLDVDKLSFPLKLRKWKNGDVFIPFGMKGKKKVSDFFTDIKLSIPAKKNVYVLVSGNDIVWIVGYRISNSFAVLDSSKSIFKIEKSIELND